MAYSRLGLSDSVSHGAGSFANWEKGRRHFRWVEECGVMLRLFTRNRSLDEPGNKKKEKNVHQHLVRDSWPPVEPEFLFQPVDTVGRVREERDWTFLRGIGRASKSQRMFRPPVIQELSCFSRIEEKKKKRAYARLKTAAGRFSA